MDGEGGELESRDLTIRSKESLHLLGMEEEEYGLLTKRGHFFQ